MFKNTIFFAALVGLVASPSLMAKTEGCTGVYDREIFLSCTNNRAGVPFWVKQIRTDRHIYPEDEARIHRSRKLRGAAYSKPSLSYYKRSEFVPVRMARTMLPYDDRMKTAPLSTFLNIFPGSKYMRDTIVPIFDDLEDDLVQKHGKVTIYTGTYFDRNEEPKAMGSGGRWNQVFVPTHFYKVYILPNGERHAYFTSNYASSGFYSPMQAKIDVERLERMTGFKYSD